MPHDNANLQLELESLKAENARLREELAITQKHRDEYRRELFLAFPPPDYTDEEIADFINNRVPADGLLEEIDLIIREHQK